MSDVSQHLVSALADRYRIERELGVGGMATVYLAHDLKHDRDVAIKVLRPELAAVLGAQRFLSEIRISARLDHPHILTLIDSGDVDGTLYYVMPWVRGESLRARLTRERQLGIDEALQITRQIAGALDYAHRQGVIHRDIKPENILFQEGEAVLADFGIALAVQEAGGTRLTETGLSIGTPHYMSPEQAFGERQLDARSDVYALGAVLYEMLAGEPPVTGPTAQAIIAKLLTETPTRLRVVRDTVPVAVESAVSQALAKVPADRFTSAAAFAAALTTGGTRAAPRRSKRWRWIPAALVGAVAVASLGVWLFRGHAPAAARVIPGSRAQLTFTGNVQAPAISPDGKQVAFFTRTCAAGGCRYSLEVEDVGATTAREILAGITAVYTGLRWSPDRRNLLAWVTIGGRFGRYLVSASTGTARYLTPGAAEFYANGDSLLVGPPFRADSVFWVRVMSLEGNVGDSFPIVHHGTALVELTAVPGSSWLVTQLYLADGGHAWQVVNRQGKVASETTSLLTDHPGEFITQAASSDALWLGAGSFTAGAPILRLAIDPRTGRLAARADTIGSGVFTSFNVTADGSALVQDDGTYEYSAWAVTLADALKGQFPDSQRVVRATSPIGAFLSPDGARLLVSRVVPSPSGGSERAFSVMPFGGGTERPLTLVGGSAGVFWFDSVSLLIATDTPHGVHFAVTDVRNNGVIRSDDIPDSTVMSLTFFPGGWGWLSTYDEAKIKRGDRTITIPKPAWFNALTDLNLDQRGERLALTGWNLGTGDSIGVAVVPAAGGTPVMWAASAAEGGDGTFLQDGSILWAVFDTQESITLYHLTTPGHLERLGTVPRGVRSLQVSNDLKRASVNVREYHGDAWITRVIRG